MRAAGPGDLARDRTHAAEILGRVGCLHSRTGLIIAKGQANYYVFSEHRAKLPGQIFCLFTIKCQPVADAVGVKPKQAVGIFL